MVKLRQAKNEYLVYYEDYKGKPHTQKVKAMTVNEAIIFIRMKDVSYKNVKAKLIKKPVTSIKKMFH